MTTPVANIGYLAGQGVLKVNDGVASAQQAFTFPVSIDAPGGEVEKVDNSSLANATRDRTYVPGMYDGGETSFTMRYCAADWERLVALKGVMKTWLLTFPPDGSGASVPTTTWSGFLTKFNAGPFEMATITDIKFSVQNSGGYQFT